MIITEYKWIIYLYEKEELKDLWNEEGFIEGRYYHPEEPYFSKIFLTDVY